MKTVLLLRHAKSSWSQPILEDFDRPLAKRGLKDAPRMAEVLLKFDSVPEKILSSPAERAKQTSELVANACGLKTAIDWQPSFYGGGSEDMISALQRLPQNIERVMLVGHNPTMEETVITLLSEQDTGWEDEFAIKIPTAGLVCLDLHITDWSILQPGDAVLRWFLIPKLVKAIQQ